MRKEKPDVGLEMNMYRSIDAEKKLFNKKDDRVVERRGDEQ
jgi:hypothetical protein